MKEHINKIMPYISVVSMVGFFLTLFLLASGIGDNRTEILISRQANVVGRLQILQEIDKICKSK